MEKAPAFKGIIDPDPPADISPPTWRFEWVVANVVLLDLVTTLRLERSQAGSRSPSALKVTP